MAGESGPITADDALAQARALAQAGRPDAAAALTAAALAAHADHAELWNLRALLMRRLDAPEAALAAADRALALKPAFAAARVNRAAALRALRRTAEAVEDLREATHLDPALAAAWLTLADTLVEQAGPAAAVTTLDEALARNPDSLALLEGKAVLLRSHAPAARAEAFLREVDARFPDLGWVQLYLGDLEAEHDPAAGEARLRRACALDPAAAAPRLALIQRLIRNSGPGEGRALDEAAGLARGLAGAAGLGPAETKVLRDLFSRVCDFAALEALGDFRTLGRAWAAAGLHTALFRHLPRAAGEVDRRELLEQHRLASERLSQPARREPIVRPARRAAGSPLRIGLLSSDLKQHPVGYFAEPLFRHLDPARAALFCYSFEAGRPDDLQQMFEARAAAFRRMPAATSREAAQAIFDDDLDVLIELGGSTSGNRLEVLAWRPAPRQVSWLGYPHSAGLAEIDALICDPYNLPPDPGLLLERALVMPKTWIALGTSAFNEKVAIDPETPEARHGAVTFGTANNPYKFTQRSLATWAEITASVPGARFAFVRPEGASAAFRSNVLRIFEAAGVAGERVVFHAVRGAHLGFYNEIDITLDTFPLTGGTTTVEALWMGAPVVSLRGPALFERLSWSILANAGLAELVADDLASYRRIALDLAADRGRRMALRSGLRARLKESPLCDAQGFARDFLALVEAFVREREPGGAG